MRKGVKDLQNFISTKQLSIFEADKELIELWKTSLINRLSNSTANRYFINVRSFYNFLDLNEICTDPIKHISPPLFKQKKKKALTVEEANKVLEAALGSGKTIIEKRNYAVVCLQLRCCLRTKEIVEANIEDLVISKSDVVLKTKPWGTNGESAALLDNITAGALQDYLSARGATSPSNPLIASHSNRNSNKRVTERTITNIFARAMSSVGKDLNNYSLKKTALFLAAANGASQNECQELARMRSNRLAAEVFDEYENQHGSIHNRIAECLKGDKSVEKSNTIKVKDLCALLSQYSDNDMISLRFMGDGSLKIEKV